MLLRKRSEMKELIDLGSNYYTEEEYNDCLFQLDRIGKLLGGDQATFKAFNALSFSPKSILDVGCGGGLFTLRLAKKFPKAHVVGIDISPEAIRFANEKLKETPLSNVSFVLSETPTLSFPKNSFDVVTATLVCHHLSENELPIFLKDACEIAKKRVILNDLHRHFAAAFAFPFISSLLFPNRLIQQDGLLSIYRSFKRPDWKNALKEAGIHSEYKLSWHWAFRWVLSINTS